ncbi:hypothetical protein K466DRAFT_297605 [Polyporus arcularius HHB13444]|uniref:Uncharacterized protein n=1 Tax=Polyporus arcularius HHB13444 TaxID=1314778 RepID=A0A5C3P1S4_9APHY|nr:hypothetical protein K466DRAFT_297605 [Polyporus arcularius HHB13444]
MCPYRHRHGATLAIPSSLAAGLSRAKTCRTSPYPAQVRKTVHSTVDTLLTHSLREQGKSMGYYRSWVPREAPIVSARGEKDLD